MSFLAPFSFRHAGMCVVGVLLPALAAAQDTPSGPGRTDPPQPRTAESAPRSGGLQHAIQETPDAGATDAGGPDAAEPSRERDDAQAADARLNAVLRARARQRASGGSGAAARLPGRYRHYAGGYPHYVYDSWLMIQDAYQAGRDDGRRDLLEDFNVRDMNKRKDRLLNAHDKALHSGLELLKQGDYPRAVIALTLASELDQGDPACRIHLAQARLASGHYPDAAAALRRALQLQPKLIYVDLDLENHTPAADVFDRQVDALGAAVRSNPAADTSFLLGYMEFQRGRFDAAHAAFRQAIKLGNGDDAAKTYLSLTKPAMASKP